jgi:hypothetical protein
MWGGHSSGAPNNALDRTAGNVSALRGLLLGGAGQFSIRLLTRTAEAVQLP